MLGLLTLTLVISHLALVQAGFPTDPCWLEGEACVIGPDNLLSSFSEVPDVAICRQLCQDNKGCNFFSHFGGESFPFQELCLLLSSCNTLHSCEDCTTEEISCFTPCGVPLEGRIADNLVDIITGVTTELDCKFNCSANPGCNVYTYFNSEDANFPSLCSLLKEVLEPIQYCEHCLTGFPDCRNRNITRGNCSFSVGADVTPLTSYKFTETGDTPVNILALGDQDCELTVVAVGGGGSNSYGGGGSGYVASSSLTLPTSQLVVRVGGPGELSSLETTYTYTSTPTSTSTISTTSSEGQTIITALPGDHGRNYDGGAGYSGGGGGVRGSGSYDGGDGGQDGGDGNYGGNGFEGGAGSGLDISSISIEQFSLSPGVGGRVGHNSQNSPHYGGGGGGVMVDGSGPQHTVYDGKGYGGGGGGYYMRGGGNYYGHPGPGLVLLEIKPKQ